MFTSHENSINFLFLLYTCSIECTTYYGDSTEGQEKLSSGRPKASINLKGESFVFGVSAVTQMIFDQKNLGLSSGRACAAPATITVGQFKTFVCSSFTIFCVHGAAELNMDIVQCGLPHVIRPQLQSLASLQAHRTFLSRSQHWPAYPACSMFRPATLSSALINLSS